MPMHLEQILKLPNLKSPTRLYLLLAVVGMAVLGVLTMELYSIHDLSIVGGIVVGMGCLIYAPLRPLLWIAIGAAYVWFSRESKKMEHWQSMVPMIVLGFCAVIWAVHETGGQILKGLDALQQKVDALREKVDEMDSRLRKLTRTTKLAKEGKGRFINGRLGAD